MFKLKQTKELHSDTVGVNSYRLMLFDLSINGHHPGYIRYLLNYWHQENLVGKIIILVSPRFLIEHSDVVELGYELDPDNIKFLAISQDEEDGLKARSGSLNRTLRNFQEWFIFCRYAKQLDIDHALLMYYDTYQYPIAFRLNPPCIVSGIYFRPTFHYEKFSKRSEHSNNLKVKWEKTILGLVLSNPKLHTLLTIDPFAVQHLEQHLITSKLMHIPDPVEICEYAQNKLNQIKESLKIDSDRQVFLLFGALTERKGIYQLLASIQLLSETICKKIAIVLVGEAAQNQQVRIENSILDLLVRCPVQICRKYQFLPEEDVQAYFEVSDFVLALYQKHVGMSGILNLAAAKQKPVLSSDYGLMGELVMKYDLGLTVDSTNPEAIALGIKSMLDSHTLNLDGEKMQEFAKQNSAFVFSKTVFNQLLTRIK